jgi:L-asparaginase/Glu-tRNA(Gln) amidotransferase subunit D
MIRTLLIAAPFLLLFPILLEAQTKPRIAVFSGPQATVQNSEPLVTSNKARQKYGLQQIRNSDGTKQKYDQLAPQRLAVPVEVLIEMYSAHPLEKDAAELYGPPDGYVDESGNFHEQRTSSADKPVYKAILTPEDGLYLLPYMARQADGKPWEEECAYTGAPEDKCRQPFFPDASRVFEEIDRSLSGINYLGLGNMLSSRADFDFFRAVPPAGYKKGLSASERTDVGEGDIPPETLGEDFFVYKPFHLEASTRFHDLAKASNSVKKALDSGQYSGAIWLEATPYIEETLYWLNLITDTSLPIVGTVAQRPHRGLSADGPANIVHAVDYVISRRWAGDDDKDHLGAVLIEAEKIIASRQVQKTDARPGGYTATGDHGGVLGTIGNPGPTTIYFRPETLHTWKSEVNLSQLPSVVNGVTKRNGRAQITTVEIKDDDGYLIGESIPRVSVVKKVHFDQSSSAANAESEVDIIAGIEENLRSNPLSGFVAEGAAPYGNMTQAQTNALKLAVYSGMPTVIVGRGNAGGMTATNIYNVFIEGNNLTASKARLLLIAAIMKFGSLPFAKDPKNPSADEIEAIGKKIGQYQAIFDTH